jgi:D-psicose/D-tagatose/L-ribulose 3-epimerase
MRLAASNIGWNPDSLDEMIPRLAARNVEGLVIAPTMVFSEGPNASRSDVTEFRQQVEDAGLVIVAMQSLTYGLKNASLFGEEHERRRLAEHLKRQAQLAGQLGATSLIFGSPGLRQENIQPQKAVKLFKEVAVEAVNNDAKLCIEPLSGYGNQFVTTTRQGIELVQEVDHSGFGLHLDSAAIAGAGENADVIVYAQKMVGIQSFDASAPDLMPPTHDASVEHQEMAYALRRASYTGFISLEMRTPAPELDAPIERFLYEVDFIRGEYNLPPDEEDSI